MGLEKIKKKTAMLYLLLSYKSLSQHEIKFNVQLQFIGAFLKKTSYC